MIFQIDYTPDLSSESGSHSAEEFSKLLLSYLQEYRQTRDSDRDEFNDLLERAMGDRSARQFCEEANINPSKLSRIRSGQTANVSNDFLLKIVTHADPNSGVTIDKLLDALGREKKDSSKQYMDACRRILADELLQHNYAVKYGTSTASESKQNILSDFEISTDALTGRMDKWIFQCKIFSDYSFFPAGFGRTDMWLNSAMAYYYTGGRAGRISIIVERRSLYEQLCQRLSKIRIPNEISVILISTAADRVLDEYVAPLSDGRRPKTVFSVHDRKEKELSEVTNLYE